MFYFKLKENSLFIKTHLKTGSVKRALMREEIENLFLDGNRI